jgi:impB/mucB/samB family C-terminal domain
MPACIENAALPPLESTTLPLFDSTSLPRIESAPTWTIRVARPVSADRNNLAQELRGVPKATLRHVFGKVLGTRLWHTNTTETAKNSRDAAPTLDAQISTGMLRYICAEAAATLRERKRLAKSISLTLHYPNGESETAHQLLLQSTNDQGSLEAAAHAAIRGMRSDAFASLKIDLTATQA